MEGTSPPGKRRPADSRADRPASHDIKDRLKLFGCDLPIILIVVGIVLVGTLLWHQTHIKRFWASARDDRPPIISQASMTFTLQRSRFLLFGDSLTERGFGLDGWAASLAHQYQRRVDVVNRGLGGYNTHWGLHVATDVLHGTNAQNTRLVTLFFGANDAARPDGPSLVQHVTLKEYKENLRQLVARVRATGVKRIVLLTPPPVYDQGRKEWQVVKVGEEAAASLTLDRTLDYTAAYAKACMSVAKELELPVINLFDAMQQSEGWGSLYFVDGLHFTSEGNQFVYKRLMETLEESYPELSPEAMPLHFPPWDCVNDTVLASFAGLRKQGEFAEGPLPGPNHPAGNLAKPKP